MGKLVPGKVHGLPLRYEMGARPKLAIP
jgi:hypothetical protein